MVFSSTGSYTNGSKCSVSIGHDTYARIVYRANLKSLNESEKVMKCTVRGTKATSRSNLLSYFMTKSCQDVHNGSGE
uniref:AlNc14C439G11656 protein n=1 Tax=Albugo laibachii Nc14 TaxID=890382 RepID=F0WZR5_9STRA|nr:AlNc14C439G11656 [Albugo laibachii Nc14]|eukprot:CCA26992.1 AlNc14C439G11656 [Albugo laibachii Nc14]